MRLLRRPDEADNVMEASLYNSYSLGSRMQYRLTAGTKALIVEQSRAAAPQATDDKMLVGWDAADALFVGD